MDIPSNLPPELQEIEDILQKALKKGGIKACWAVVNKLATEAEFSRLIADEAELAALKIEEDADTFPEIREAAEVRLRELLQMKLDGDMVTIRHTYAVVRLMDFRRAVK